MNDKVKGGLVVLAVVAVVGGAYLVGRSDDKPQPISANPAPVAVEELPSIDAAPACLDVDTVTGALGSAADHAFNGADALSYGEVDLAASEVEGAADDWSVVESSLAQVMPDISALAGGISDELNMSASELRSGNVGSATDHMLEAQSLSDQVSNTLDTLNPGDYELC